MKIELWLTYTGAISCLVFGLSKGIKPLIAFSGNFQTISFVIGLMILGFAFGRTSGLFVKKSKVLSDDYDEEFHNDFSKVGSGTDIIEVKPEDHTLATKAQGHLSKTQREVKALTEKD